MNKRGFTLVELLVGMFVALLALSSVMSSYVMLKTFWREGNIQIDVQGDARLAMSKIMRSVRQGIEANVSNNGNTLRIRLDPDRTEIAGDDIWCQYDFADSSISFDSGQGAGSVPLLNNVYKQGAADVFSANGRNISVVFRASDPASFFYYRGTFLQSSATLRNE